MHTEVKGVVEQEARKQNNSICILALPHWEMACCAVSAPSEMKLRGKPSALPRT